MLEFVLQKGRTLQHTVPRNASTVTVCDTCSTPLFKQLYGDTAHLCQASMSSGQVVFHIVLKKWQPYALCYL